jgi:hypothetical protein
MSPIPMLTFAMSSARMSTMAGCRPSQCQLLQCQVPECRLWQDVAHPNVDFYNVKPPMNVECQTTEQLKLKEIARIVIVIVPILPNHGE